ncbi:Fe-S cluster assembly ATPase SufC [Candidatus Falkowbacteria bacterium]|uniref:Fe-S cluster assembly ATPase SufC n=1 Tax=Candidatus Falkowbacteria bacterium CG10_big_fil_rev_8_21_14_0_10_37_18 TaxID=1974562 RepID=A0A2H0V9C6_9BACT|nr:Fe-S cluster assembly ATPase SufC [Candidatus Falkowbacteria bacterium]NCQ12516.1 Fe-S cluster assembly ATPase SufC [Candidatus Falkowbacteria bacterium]OIO06059.1 MAG: Fe-S cluster assembly ATPase SufC [Candidatus Falkowbacteria bacterium CG1_02_37_21]PIR95706.1 MAG: Fe-S cluster assembly ATPase SufC [Candidatus Falkowbacteria bacterium CG10_big_fil_rev_8_21_14_0_10_37_18]
MNTLEVKHLTVKVGDKKILDDVSLVIKKGKTCVVMGPNGSGKSTLSNVLMGHPSYEVISGKIIFNGKDITKKKAEERAALGMFMTFQSPREIVGVDFYPFLFDTYKFLQTARKEKALSVFEFKKKMDKEIAALKITDDWSQRCLNQGFSGGEKKKAEMLQLAIFKPSFVIFDEIDSGLDVDALKVVGRAMKKFKKSDTSALIVTHYLRILQEIEADQVIVMSAGKIIQIGGPELAHRLEKEGFEKIIAQK